MLAGGQGDTTTRAGAIDKVLQWTVATGIVKFYKNEKGWGAITSDSLPPSADVWVHYSAIEGDGYRELAPGDLVEFDYEEVRQDSFQYRATRVKRLAPGPAPTLRRRGTEVRIEPDGSPDTPLSSRRPRGQR